ncbi:hypothetical protein [Ensifer sesbaniae]|nr:hypothetical protein [Ensifer sesbaniae]
MAENLGQAVSIYRFKKYRLNRSFAVSWDGDIAAPMVAMPRSAVGEPP